MCSCSLLFFFFNCRSFSPRWPLTFSFSDRRYKNCHVFLPTKFVSFVFLCLALQSRDISIRHFQYGGVCLHFARTSFNTVFGKSNFKSPLYLVR